MIEKIPIYIKTSIREVYWGFIYLCTKKPNRNCWVSIPSHFIIRQGFFTINSKIIA